MLETKETQDVSFLDVKSPSGRSLTVNTDLSCGVDVFLSAIVIIFLMLLVAYETTRAHIRAFHQTHAVNGATEVETNQNGENRPTASSTEYSS